MVVDVTTAGHGKKKQILAKYIPLEHHGYRAFLGEARHEADNQVVLVVPVKIISATDAFARARDML